MGFVMLYAKETIFSGPRRRGQIPPGQRRLGLKYRHIPSPHLPEPAVFASGRDHAELIHAA
jgi:hypothetical protein